MACAFSAPICLTRRDIVDGVKGVLRKNKLMRGWKMS